MTAASTTILGVIEVLLGLAFFVLITHGFAYVLLCRNFEVLNMLARYNYWAWGQYLKDRPYYMEIERDPSRKAEYRGAEGIRSIGLLVLLISAVLDWMILTQVCPLLWQKLVPFFNIVN